MKPLIHIGYHKTASTMLQKGLWNNSQAGFTAPTKDGEMSEESKELISSPYPFTFSTENTKKLLCPFIENAEKNGFIPVLSAERFSGHPYSGGFNTKDVADRLHELFPEAKILIIIREQADMILSSYKHFVASGGTSSLKNFIEPYKKDYLSPGFCFQYLEYNRLISYYCNLFGGENVLALPYEMIKKNPEVFIEKIINFGGAKKIPPLDWGKRENQGISYLASRWLKFANIFKERGAFNRNSKNYPTIYKLLRKIFSILESFIPASVVKSSEHRAKDFIVAKLKDRYHLSNIETGQLVGENLGSYGYK